MKRQIFIGLYLLIIFCAVSARGQKLENKIDIYQPNFSGTWNLDMSRSKFDALTRELLKEELKSYSLQMIIEQNFPIIKITTNDKNKQEGSKKDNSTIPDLNTQIYFADGRGEDEPVDTKVSNSQVVAKIVGEKLMITFYGLDSYRKKKVFGTIEYSLSNNGHTLVQERKFIPVIKPKNSTEEKEANDLMNSYLVFTRSK